MTLHAALKPLQNALATATPNGAREALKIIAPDAVVHMCAPFGDVLGKDTYDTFFAPLLNAMPDLEPRDTITLSGTTPKGETWVGCMGNYMGTMIRTWLDIPPTGHLIHMRYYEFFRIENNTVTQAQIIWDIPEVMVQANAWPMAPQLEKFLCKYPSNPDPAVMNLENTGTRATIGMAPRASARRAASRGFATGTRSRFLRPCRITSFMR